MTSGCVGNQSALVIALNSIGKTHQLTCHVCVLVRLCRHTVVGKGLSIELSIPAFGVDLKYHHYLHLLV